jgi:hypothetical protein
MGVFLEVVEVVDGLVTLLFTLLVLGSLTGIMGSHLLIVGIGEACAVGIVEEECLVKVVGDLEFVGESLVELLLFLVGGLEFVSVSVDFESGVRYRKKVDPSVDDIRGHGGGDKGMREAILALSLTLVLVEIVADPPCLTLLHETCVLWRERGSRVGSTTTGRGVVVVAQSFGNSADKSGEVDGVHLLVGRLENVGWLGGVS